MNYILIIKPIICNTNNRKIENRLPLCRQYFQYFILFLFFIQTVKLIYCQIPIRLCICLENVYRSKKNARVIHYIDNLSF